MRQEAEKYLRALGAELKTAQASTLRKLDRRAEEKLRGRGKFIEVVTGVEAGENLLPLETDASIFFANEPPFEARTLPYGPFFLRVPYAEFFELLDRDFRGAGFTYQLKINPRFVEAEAKLFRLARLYDVPLEIFSPYARRAVDICIFGEPAELDLRLAENNLAGKLLLDKKFFWNVETGAVQWESFQSRGKFFEYRCTVPDALSFVLPYSDSAFDATTEVRREEDQLIFLTPREFSRSEGELVRILPVESKIAARILSKARLRTQGDIEFVLSGLARDDYACRFGNFGGGENIRRYAGAHEYFSALDENLLRAKKNLPTCTVKFSGEEFFLADYANFVLHFLSENYPEFNWAGERDA